MRSTIILCSAAACVAAFAFFAGSRAVLSSTTALSIAGIVKNPLNLTVEDLRNFQQATVRYNALGSGGEYHGAFIYRGVPLKFLLEAAHIEKEETDFFKPVDTVIILKNSEGKRAVLSWAEVMYRQPSDVIIAVEGAPVMPQKGCGGCHKKGEYERWLDPLKKTPGFPRLVIPGDASDGRCIEGLCSIEAVDLHLKVAKEKGKAQSPQFTVSGAGKQLLVKNLAGFERMNVKAVQIGDGKGFHGVHEYGGVLLADLVGKSGIVPSMEGVFVATAPDGYRSVISAGELFLGATGKETIVADIMNGKDISAPSMGKFHLVVPGDLAADRWVKALKSIEYMPLGNDSKLYIVGMGCGDTSLVTLEAISYIARADSVVCSDDIKQRYAHYIGQRKVLFDPLMNMAHYYKKKNPSVTKEEAEKKSDEFREKNIGLIKKELESGRSVAFLEYGDPALWGSWTYWVRDQFTNDRIQVVPGVSALNAGSAMIAKNVAAKGSLVVTVPRGIKENEKLLETVAKSGDTVVIFIGLREMETLAPLLGKYYPGDTPVAVAYKAGYSHDGKLMRTTLKELPAKAAGQEEQFLGIIYIGDAAK